MIFEKMSSFSSFGPASQFTLHAAMMPNLTFNWDMWANRRMWDRSPLSQLRKDIMMKSAQK